MGFDASNAVEALDWDFAPHVQASGTVPEPSDRILRGFQAAMTRNLTDLGVDRAQLGSPQQLVAALADVDEKKLEKAADKVNKALADLCQGSPSLEQLEQLPPRVRNAFMGWLTGLLFGTGENPTLPSPVTSRSLATVNGAVAAG
jgi:hypothetical protein